MAHSFTRRDGHYGLERPDGTHGGPRAHRRDHCYQQRPSLRPWAGDPSWARLGTRSRNSHGHGSRSGRGPDSQEGTRRTPASQPRGRPALPLRTQGSFKCWKIREKAMEQETEQIIQARKTKTKEVLSKFQNRISKDWRVNQNEKKVQRRDRKLVF